MLLDYSGIWCWDIYRNTSSFKHPFPEWIVSITGNKIWVLLLNLILYSYKKTVRTLIKPYFRCFDDFLKYYYIIAPKKQLFLMFTYIFNTPFEKWLFFNERNLT